MCGRCGRGPPLLRGSCQHRVRAYTQAHPRTAPTNTDINIRFVTRFGRVPLLLRDLCATFMSLVLSPPPLPTIPPSLTPFGSLTCLFEFPLYSTSPGWFHPSSLAVPIASAHARSHRRLGLTPKGLPH